MYNDRLLYAPYCAFKNNMFYLYYCQPDRETTEGVATSASPTGPFTNGQHLELGGYNQIDPSLFIDDDGRAYYLWGQFTLKMAKMKPNMRELDLSTVKDSVLTEDAHFFHEGAFLAKRNGIYYLVYADISRAEMPTCLGHATSTAPFGPYQYRGVIVDNDHCNPGNWNNHGSIVEFRGKWYVFYHRSTHGCNTMRKACLEPIHFNPDGSIPEVEMTSQGAGDPLEATSPIEAERACLLCGNVRIQQFTTDNEELARIENGDRAVFKYIHFKQGIKSISLRIAPGANGGRIIVSVDQPWHHKIADIDIPAGTGEKVWQTLTYDVKSITGIHTLWLQFYEKGSDLLAIDWLTFN